MSEPTSTNPELNTSKEFSFAATKKRLDTARDAVQTDPDDVHKSAGEGNIFAKRAVAESEKVDRVIVRDEDYFKIGEKPLGVHTWEVRGPDTGIKEPGQETELSVYAEFYSSTPDSRGFRSALVRQDVPGLSYDQQPNKFMLIGFDPDDEDVVHKLDTQSGKRVMEGIALEIVPVGGQLIKVKNVPFNGIKTQLEASVPSQHDKAKKLRLLAEAGNLRAAEILRNQQLEASGAKAAFHPEATYLESQEQVDTILEAAERFPADKSLNITINRGGYEYDEAYREAIETQIKGAWVLYAERFGLEPKDFPNVPIELWAPALLEKSRANFRNRWRNRSHKDKFPVKQFAAEPGAHYIPPTEATKERVVAPIDASGKISLIDMIHELEHARYTHEDMQMKAHTWGMMTNEGLASISNIILREALDDPHPQLGDKDKQASFDRLIAASQLQVNDEIPSLRSNEVLYSVSNAILHFYLLKERGGTQKLYDLTHHPMNTRHELLYAYADVYNEPLPDLVAKAKEWFETRSNENT